MLSAPANGEARFALAPLLKNKSFLLASLITLVIAASFWGGSRYPQLDQKAIMAGGVGLAPLGFDAIVSTDKNASIPRQILNTAINWGETNKRGMLFGLLFAAALLTLFSLFKKQSFDSHFSNSALGVAIGTPLGVCVNCAAPIAQGLHASGMRLETTVAAMISSPTMNPIVLAMMFSLFPVYMVALKMGLTVVFLFLLLPLLARFVFKEEVALTDKIMISKMIPENIHYTPFLAEPPGDEEERSWGKALRWFTTNYGRNLWFILKMAVPLMILAGFLGATLVTVMPLESLREILPSSSNTMIILGMAMVGLIGIFLPVPMAFDVIATSVLMAAGLPVHYAMVLLFTLGVFSIYSFLIVRKMISMRVASVLFLVLAGIGVTAGVAAHVYKVWDDERKQAFLFASWEQLTPVEPERTITSRGENGDAIIEIIKPNIMHSSVMTNIATPGISIEEFQLFAPGTSTDKLFTRLRGDQIGVNRPHEFSIAEWIEPYIQFHGIASGDIHNDGWVDLLLSSQSGLFLYANNRGEFIQQEIAVPGLRDMHVINAALVDLNNDGWQDIYFSAHRGGNHVIYNDHGQFSESSLEQLPNHEQAWMSMAATFADLDRDSDLDLVLGNWSLGPYVGGKFLGRPSSRNIMLRNNGNGFGLESLAGVDGETMVTMLSDFDGDNHLDLIVGNDFRAPDIFYHGEEDGRFSEIPRQAGIIPRSSRSTMSIASSDIDNDLSPEIFLANVSGVDHSMLLPFKSLCDEHNGGQGAEKCKTIRAAQALMVNSIRKRDPFMCTDLATAEERQACIGLHILNEAWWEKDYELCRRLDGHAEALSFVCSKYFSMHDEPLADHYDSNIPQIVEKANVLLVPDGAGHFEDRALPMGLAEAGWVWNARFADLDQDEYQDIYMATGYVGDKNKSSRESNHFFRNLNGKSFVDETVSSGLELFQETTSYTYADIDNDGDLDIMAVEGLGPAWAFINNSSTANAISIELRDQRGNNFGIGSKIIIRYGEKSGRQQMRELQAGGGFLSYDAPIAHFGLGDINAIDQVEIIWSTGERTVLKNKLLAGHRYRITRAKQSVPELSRAD